ncbi:alpha/beta hydrolase [Aurantiacibacter spongiae]|uniref:Alpha/beta hydrolase n=2 Tax=Aurantiacibacter spongiae TaxID=2488860 RepID=A0A3N5DTJ5_9SPHN|nr:alpha/beta hydrolase [Aurantiacibacter spongiae]
MKALLAALFVTSIAACSADSKPADPIPEHDELTVSSDILDEDRVINVFVPPQYDGGQTAFPVVYMPDGGIDEDFPHIANTLAGLIARGAVPPVILVGIENTERGRDLTPSSTTDYDRDYAPQGDGARAFRAFIRDELMPEIDARYRTADGRTIIGESSAGLFVVDTFFREPGLFDHYIAMDPALWWNDHDLVRQAASRLAAMDAAGKSLWFAGSGAADIQPHTRALADALSRNAPQGLRWIYRDRPGERHDTIFRATKDDALTWSLGAPASGRTADRAADGQAS